MVHRLVHAVKKLFGHKSDSCAHCKPHVAAKKGKKGKKK